MCRAGGIKEGKWDNCNGIVIKKKKNDFIGNTRCIKKFRHLIQTKKKINALDQVKISRLMIHKISFHLDCKSK